MFQLSDTKIINYYKRKKKGKRDSVQQTINKARSILHPPTPLPDQKSSTFYAKQRFVPLLPAYGCIRKRLECLRCLGFIIYFYLTFNDKRGIRAKYPNAAYNFPHKMRSTSPFSLNSCQELHYFLREAKFTPQNGLG